MFDRIDIGGILRDHVRTLRSYRTGKYRPGDFLLFFAFPGAIAGVLVLFDVRADKTLTLLVTILSILGGLLFNLLLLIYDSSTKASPPMGQRDEVKRRLLKEMHANIAFEILLSVVALLIALSFALGHNSVARAILSFALLWVVGVFMLTLLMVLKRVRALLTAEFDQEARRATPESELVTSRPSMEKGRPDSQT